MRFVCSLFVVAALSAVSTAQPPQAPPLEVPPQAPVVMVPPQAPEPVVASAPEEIKTVKSDPKGATFKVHSVHGVGSGVCVASEKGWSLVLSNNHVFAKQPAPGTVFPLAGYPVPAALSINGKLVEGTAVAGDLKTDLALVVVKADLPVAELAETEPAPGADVRHYGFGSGGGAGKVLEPDLSYVAERMHFSTTCPSASGDSGCAIFDAQGRVVAVHNGHIGERTFGAPVRTIRSAIRDLVPHPFKRLRERLNAPGVGPAIPVQEPFGKPVAAPAQAPAVQNPCPNGTCPPQQPFSSGYRVVYPQYVLPVGGTSCPNGTCPAPGRSRLIR